MLFKELLAVTDSKQKIKIFEGDKFREEDNCLCLWECNSHFERIVVGVKCEGDLLIVTF